MGGHSICGISFSIGGFFQGYAEIKLECERGAWWERHRGFPGSSGRGFGWSVDRVLSGSEAAALKTALEDSGALRWRKEYWSPATDGEQWSLVVQFSDGSTRKSDGSNMWPKGFDALFAQIVKLGFPCEFEGREDDPRNIPEYE